MISLWSLTNVDFTWDSLITGQRGQRWPEGWSRRYVLRAGRKDVSGAVASVRCEVSALAEATDDPLASSVADEWGSDEWVAGTHDAEEGR